MEKLLPDNYLSNSTFNEEILMDTLNEIKKSSYSYITEVQADLVGYHRFDFNMSDFKLDRGSVDVFTTAKRFVINVPKQLIPTSNKELYKRSDVFMKELSIQEIASRNKVFVYNFIVFIDGKSYTNLKLVIGEDMTRLVLHINNEDGFNMEYFDELVAENAKVTVFFIPNCLYGNHTTNKYILRKYNNELPLSRFTMYGDLGKNAIAYSMITPDKTTGSMFSTSISIEDELVQVANNYERYLSRTTLDLGVITFNHFDRQIDIPIGGDYFELPIRQHIVPLTSFMAFYEDGGVLKYYHDLQIEYHYPNIYRITGNNVPLKLNVFYYEPSDNSHFVNEMELYYRFFGDKVLEKWKNGTIPDLIKNFVPSEYPVSIKGLLASQYRKDPLLYKTDKMNEFIDIESRKLGAYLQNMMKDRKKMRIYTKHIHLPDRIRMGVSQEIPSNPTVFEEEHYVFTFAKYFLNEYELRFFIDGVFFVCRQIYHDDGYYYFYIPKRLITPDSIIDIEKHRSISYYHEVTFDEPVKSVYIHENPCKASDTLFIDENGLYLKERCFKFIINEDGKEIEIDTDSDKQLGDNFKIKCTEEDYMNRGIQVLFKRQSSVFEYKVVNQEDEDKTLLIGTPLSRHDGHFRIYRNGRLLPPAIYTIKHKKRHDAFTVINIKMKKKIGDVYHIELNPNMYYTNYFSYKITNEGIIDFAGKLNKPFNLKWFDVFLNGYKLTEYNFDILTPRFVLIKGVKTTDNLLILEKNWKDDIFKFRTTDENPIPPEFIPNNSFDDNLIGSDKELYDEIDKIREEIIEDDTIDNILTDIIEDTSDELIRFMPELFEHFFNPNPYINPDVMYSPEGEVRDEIIKFLGERDNIIQVYPEVVPNVTTPVIINPDTDELLDADQLETSNGVVIH